MAFVTHCPRGNVSLSLNSLAKRFYYEIRPTSKVKIFSLNPNKKLNLPKKVVRRLPCAEKKLGPRKNKLGIQMISKALYDQIFLEGYRETSCDTTIEESKKELLKHMMNSDKVEPQADVNFKLPPLQGKTIEEHFLNIGNAQVHEYKTLVMELLEGIPTPPKKWLLQEGWTRYEPGVEPQKVNFPLEAGLVFDVEVCMMVGKIPTLAAAVSSKAWYSWVSQSLIDCTCAVSTSHQYHMEDLIPLESVPKDNGINLNSKHLKPKIIIGHNVSYDRARIKEQYWVGKTGTRFLDTMSLHICVSGLTSYQRALMKSSKFEPEDESWSTSSCLNNLADVYNLYCKKNLNKETRNIFVEGTLLDIKNDFQNVMQYCSRDVKATYEVLQELFPMFLARFPHPVTLAGMFELGTAHLPINQNWNRYISESEQSFEDLENEGIIHLARRADQACHLLHHSRYTQDLWFWDEDWDVKDIKLKMNLVKRKQEIEKKYVAKDMEGKMDNEDHSDDFDDKFEDLWKTKDLLPKVRTLLPGYPNWYRKLCTKPNSTTDWIPGPYLLSTSMKIAPKLLSLTWEGYPLHHIKEKGWGFLIPFSDDLQTERKLPLKQLWEKCPLQSEKGRSVKSSDALSNIIRAVDEHIMKKEFYSRLMKNNTGGLYKGAGIWCNTEVEDCCWFFKLPHKDGPAYNVGNPLAKDFLNKFSENVLAGDSKSAEEVLAIARKLSYWRNNRNRILDQMIVWLSKENLPKELSQSGFAYGAIIPQVVVCGTLTRRAMEPTWMTASNAHLERVGSELKSMVQALPGYSIVGADVDSQELWIASILGDSHQAKIHGATPLGWMTLSGTKAEKTDMHSMTAQAVGISRDHAKVMNYARIYGAGQQFAERLLRQFNPSMSESETRSKAQKMFTLTKGKKLYFLKPEHLLDFPDKPYGKWQAFEIAKACGKTIDEMFHKSKWVGGTESAMFNCLEQIANSSTPCTPFLGGRLTRALESKSHTDRFLTTRVNWVVQSGAVDFLHLLLVCMKWIMGDKARFCISFHDEVRYVVPEEYKYQAALALHVSNLLTRSFCAYKLGLHDLPQSVAFFSSVEVDSVLRKDCDNDCQTPSNPHGLEKGYGIKSGESLDIHKSIEKAKGQFSCWYDHNKTEKK